MTEFKARRPFIKNIIRFFVSAVVATAVAFAFMAIYEEAPSDLDHRIFQCVAFCVFMIWELFTLSFFADSLRNLLAPPTVEIKNGKIKVFGYKEAELSEIERTEITNLARNPKKSFPAIAIYLKNEEEPVLIKKGFTGIPLDTVKYAIDTRISKK